MMTLQTGKIHLRCCHRHETRQRPRGCFACILIRREAVACDTPRVASKADIARWRPSAASRLRTHAPFGGIAQAPELTFHH